MTGWGVSSATTEAPRLRRLVKRGEGSAHTRAIPQLAREHVEVGPPNAPSRFTVWFPSRVAVRRPWQANRRRRRRSAVHRRSHTRQRLTTGGHAWPAIRTEKSAKGQYMFNLKAANNQVILSSELYNEKASAQNGIESVKAHRGTDANYERKTSKKGEPFFVLKAPNGQIIGRARCMPRPRAWTTALRPSRRMPLGPAW